MIIGTPFSTQTADDPDDAFMQELKVEGLVKSCTLTSNVLIEDSHLQLPFTTTCAASVQISGCISSKIIASSGARISIATVLSKSF